MARRFTTPVGLVALAEDPAAGISTAGDMYFNTTSGIIRTFNGSVWTEITAEPGSVGPQGPQGEQGETGPAPWTLVGPYDNGVSYTLGDAVTYQGGFYYRTGNPLNPGYPPTPGSINASWTPVADRGEQGIQGEVGPQGIQGPQGVKGDTGAFGGATFEYEFDTGTTHTTLIGDGIFRFNETDVTAATYLYISFVDYTDTNIQSFLLTIDDSSSAVKGTFKVTDVNNPLDYAYFSIVGSLELHDDHYHVPIAFVSATELSPTDGTHCYITFARTGDIGDTGPQGPQGLGYKVTNVVTDIPIGYINYGSVSSTVVSINTNNYAYAVGDPVKLVNTYSATTANPILSGVVGTTPTALDWNGGGGGPTTFNTGSTDLTVYLNQYIKATDNSGSGWVIGAQVTSTPTPGTLEVYYYTLVDPTSPPTVSSSWTLERDLDNSPLPQEGPNPNTFVTGTITSVNPGNSYTVGNFQIEPNGIWESNTVSMSITGFFGATGATGAMGETGPVGADGPMGPAGYNGMDGVNGVNGMDGAPGLGYGFEQDPGQPSQQVINFTDGSLYLGGVYSFFGKIGAYKAGDYVRINLDGLTDTYLEGRIYSTTPGAWYYPYDSIAIVVHSWFAPSGYVSSGGYPVTMNIIGKSGAGYNFGPYVENSMPVPGVNLTASQWTTPTTELPLYGRLGAYKVGDYVKATAKDSTTEVLYPNTYFKGYITELADVGTAYENMVVTVDFGVNPDSLSSTDKWQVSIAGIDGAEGAGYNITLNADYYTEPGYWWMTDKYVSLVETQTLLASDPSDYASLGNSIALSGDGNTAVLGAKYKDDAPYTDNGAIYVFTKSGSTWVEQAKLLASDLSNYENFGASVAISYDGNTIAVGSPFNGTAPYYNDGSVYVFTRSGSTWTDQAFIVASDRETNDVFGSSVAISEDGNTLLIGAPNETTSPNTSNGAAYVYVRSGSTWTEQQKLLASIPGTYDSFGRSVALSGDGNTAAIGAVSKDKSVNDNTGAVYMFTRTSGVWTESSIVRPNKPTNEEYFGNRVQLSGNGNTLVVANESNFTRYVYVFNKVGSSWVQKTRLYTKDDTWNSFGSEIALSGDGNTILVGALYPNGAVYVFINENNNWVQKRKIKSSNLTNENFGSSVALSFNGESALVGAQGNSQAPITANGAAYSYSLLASRLEFPFDTYLGAYTDKNIVQAINTENPSSSLDGVLTIAESGMSYITPTSVDGTFVANTSYEIRIHSIGKVGPAGPTGETGQTGLGYDVVVSAKYSNVATAKIISSDLDSGQFGDSVAISEDGTTAIVGKPFDSTSPNFYNGSAYIFVKSGDTWVEQAKLDALDKGDFDNFGSSVAISDDGNTVLIGSPYNAAVYSGQGAAYAFVRYGTDWYYTNKLISSDSSPSDYFGRSVALSGDGNTALIGAPYQDSSGQSNNGAAYVFTTSSSWSSYTQQQKLLASDLDNGDSFGFSVALSTDGSTALIGANYEFTSPNYYNGAAYVFVRSFGSWSQEAKLLASDIDSGDQFGQSVALSGDGNTALIGAPYDASPPKYGVGSAYIFTRSFGVWTQEFKLAPSDLLDSDYFGWSVALSTDGTKALVSAQNGELGSLSDAGSVYVFVKPSSTWTQQQKLFASKALNNGDAFGRSVSISGDGNVGIVGAPYAEESSEVSDLGTAYIFDFTASPALNWASGVSVGAYVDQSYVKAIDTDNASNYTVGTLTLNSPGLQYVTPDTQAGTFVLGNTYSVRLSISGTPGTGGSSKLVRHDWVPPYDYMATAPSGTSESSSGWNITRIEVLPDGSTVVNTASDSWDNRLTAVYS
jgi:hypothetical protein